MTRSTTPPKCTGRAISSAVSWRYSRPLPASLEQCGERDDERGGERTQRAVVVRLDLVEEDVATMIDRIAVPIEEVAQQPLPVTEVVLQGVGVLLVGGAGDLAHRRQLDPLFGEQPQRRVEQCRAGVARVARTRSCQPDPPGGALEERQRRRVQPVADLTRCQPGARPGVRCPRG